MSARILLATAMSWPFAAQLAGAFCALGAEVEALCPPGSLLAVSRHPVRRHRYQALAPMASLRAAAARARPDLVIACDDMAAGLVQKTEGRAAPGRLDFLVRAALAGAPAAATVVIDAEERLNDAVRRFGLPLVLKCDHSWGGDGVAIAATRLEASAVFRRLARQSRLRNAARALRRKDSSFLTRALFPVPAAITAQRFIAGHPATSSIACWQGRVVAAHHFDVRVTSEATGPACVVAPVDCAQMAASATAVAGAFHLTGLFGLDYVRDASGTVHLLEMNMRATPTAHLALKDDLAAGLLKAAGFPARPRPPATGRSEIALFPREWLRDPASAWLRTAFHDVPWDDPAVVRDCARQAPAAARVLLEEAAPQPALAATIPVFDI